MKSRPLKVLVCPGGTENGLEIWKSLRFCKEITLFSAASDVPNHAQFVYKRHFIVPPVADERWLDEINALVRKYSIDYLYPANSFVIDALIRHWGELRIRPVMAAPDVCGLTRSKRATYSLLAEHLPVPRVYDAADDISEYPVFVKPDRGYGSQGSGIAYGREHLEMLMERDASLLVCEHLAGREYTVDCFSTNRSGLLFCAGRERRRIRMGTSMQSEDVGSDLNGCFRAYAERILSVLPVEGAWFFQMREDVSGALKLLEVEARIAGTMALHRVQGINFPLLHIFLLEGLDVSTLVNRMDVVIDRALVNRYHHQLAFHTVYVDLDDTLVVHDSVNTQLVQFLFQEINRGTRLVLLSKSLHRDREGELVRRRVHGVFDEIIWLDEDQSKADFIRPEGAIFIDDSFSQRREVSERHGIPTFDPSMVELLLDERG